MSQPAGARRAKIRHSRCSTGWTPNRPTLTAAFNNERRYTTGEVVCVWHRKKENERRKLRKTELKREGKTLSHSASCLRKGRGWRHLVLSHSQTVETSAIFNIKCTGGWCPVLLTESSPVLQGSHQSVHYCVRLREEEKKRREQRRERKPVSLCGEDSAGKWFCDYLSLPAKRGSSHRPAATSHLLCASFAFTPESHMSVLLRPANSDTRASPDDESWRQTGFHEYWCGG